MDIKKILKEIGRTDSNAVSLINALLQMQSTSSKSVSINWESVDGSLSTIQIPSITKLLGEISLLKDTLKEITKPNLKKITLVGNGNNVSTLILQEPMQEPESFSFPKIITKHSLELNLDSQLKNEEHYALVENATLYKGFEFKKYIISNSDYFRENLLQKNFSELELLSLIQDSNSPYTVEKGRVLTGISEFKDSGSFIVTSISGSKVKLSTTSYRNYENRELNLQEGQNLILNRDTLFKIETINTLENQVVLSKTSGNSILTSSSNLKLQGEVTTPNIKIPIGKESNFFVFLRAIDLEKNVVSIDWGKGQGVIPSLLLDSANVPLDQTTIVDYISSIKAISEDSILSNVNIEIPNIPVISLDNFTVSTLNLHKKQDSRIVELQNLKSKRIEITEKVNANNESLGEIQSELSLLDSSKVEDQKGINILKEEELKYVRENEKLNSQVTSISNQLLQNFEGTEEFKAKFGIVGVVEYPQSKNGQLIRGLELEYRYLTVEGLAVELNSKEVIKSGKKARLAPSKWIKYPKTFRKKNLLGNFDEEDLENIDVNTPNQFIVPITRNEIVEVRVRSISDAGYPLKEISSDWSESVKFNFPESLIENSNSIVKEIEKEKNNKEFQEEFGRRKLNGHTNDTFNEKDKTFAHKLENLATTYKTPEEATQDAQSAMDELKLRINTLEKMLNSTKGKISMRILDSNDREVAIVKNNEVVKIDGGLYSELVKDLETKKGGLINQDYKIEITNTADGDIEILSYVPGNKESGLSENYDGYIFNREEYSQFRKQYLVPIAMGTEVLGDEFTSSSSFQSKQVQGQNLYGRHRDISLNKELYSEPLNNIKGVDVTGNTQETFVWNVGSNPTSASGNLSDFCVHLDHPLIATVASNISDYNVDLTKKINYDNALSQKVYSHFTHSGLASLREKEAGSIKQLSYRNFVQKTSLANINDVIVKSRFEDFDQFLIGRDTCGLYLNLKPSNRENNQVNSSSYNKGEILVKGEKLIIPFSASSRLTDYFGDGSIGLGRIGGDNDLLNVKYTKRIGLDILIKNRAETELHSFDIEYSIKYQDNDL